MAPINGRPPSKHYPDSSFNENIELTHAIDGGSSLTLNSRSTYRNTNTMATKEKINVFIVFVFILELIVLVFVSVLEFFLRATDVFPVRMTKFSCHDQSISYEKDKDTYEDFAYNADISYVIVITLSFAIPPIIILISEIALWAFDDEKPKTIRALCNCCKIPQPVRRILRFVGGFLFGMLITMIFVDVAKIFIGRLRPTFLETCEVNETLCEAEEDDHMFFSEEICLQDDESELREAMLSFPSLHTAVTAFAAFFMAIYLHNIIRNPGVRIVRPFLSLAFVILSVMCGLARIGLHYSHWTDVLAGFILGFFAAVYICCMVLNNFRERISTHQFYSTLKSYLIQHKLIELRDLYKEHWSELDSYHSGLPPSSRLHSPTPNYNLNQSSNNNSNNQQQVTDVFANGMIIPRPHIHNESSTDVIEIRPRHTDRGHAAKHKPSQYAKNTFQRDLDRAVDNYRSTRDIYPQNGHI